jgi:hypothetical protein
MAALGGLIRFLKKQRAKKGQGGHEGGFENKEDSSPRRVVRQVEKHACQEQNRIR